MKKTTQFRPAGFLAKCAISFHQDYHIAFPWLKPKNAYLAFFLHDTCNIFIYEFQESKMVYKEREGQPWQGEYHCALDRRLHEPCSRQVTEHNTDSGPDYPGEGDQKFLLNCGVKFIKF